MRQRTAEGAAAEVTYMRYLLAAAIVAALLAVGCSGDGGSEGGSGGPPDLMSNSARDDFEDSILDGFQALIEGDEDAFREGYSEECRDEEIPLQLGAMWAAMGNDEDAELGISGFEVVEQQGANATVHYVINLFGTPLLDSGELQFVWEEGRWRLTGC